MPRRRRYLGIALAALVVACACWLVRTQPPRPAVAAPAAAADHGAGGAVARMQAGAGMAAGTALPPPGTPLAQVLPRLQARANAGDLAAATRLYRDLRLCGHLDGLAWSLARVADELLEQKLDPADAGNLDDYGAQLDAIEARDRAMREFHRLCEGVDRGMLDSQLPSLRRAALLGDTRARACYLAQGPGYDPHGLMRHPQWIDRYRADVAGLIEAALAQGDWRVVDIVREAYRPGSNGMLAGVLGADADLYYRYLKLYRLGAGSHRAGALDRQLAAAAARLDPHRLAEADAWAETVFRRDFDAGSSTAATAEGWDPCSFPSTTSHP